MLDCEARCICAHMCFWEEGLAKAMQDCGVTLSQSEVVEHLRKKRWFYDEEADSIQWVG